MVPRLQFEKRTYELPFAEAGPEVALHTYAAATATVATARPEGILRVQEAVQCEDTQFGA